MDDVLARLDQSIARVDGRERRMHALERRIERAYTTLALGIAGASATSRASATPPQETPPDDQQ